MGIRKNNNPTIYRIGGSSVLEATIDGLMENNVFLEHIDGDEKDKEVIRHGLETALKNAKQLELEPVMAKSGIYCAWFVPDLSFISPFVIGREQIMMSRHVKSCERSNYTNDEYYGTIDAPIARDFDFDEGGELTRIFGYTNEDAGKVFVLVTDPGQPCADAKLIGGMFGNMTWAEHEQAFAEWKAKKEGANALIRCMDGFAHHSINTHMIASGDALLGSYGGYDYVEMAAVGGLRPYGYVDGSSSNWNASGRSGRSSGWGVAALVGGEKFNA